MHPRAEEFEERVREEHGLEIEVREFADGTKTAADAAAAVGCTVGQIASSLVFEADGDAAVVVASGANRVSEEKLAARLGVDPTSVSMADAETVKSVTGWAIGGVPPLCHAGDPPVLFDETLGEYDAVWAAAGTPTAVFPIDPETLRRCADAESVDVAE
ncbi:YbaK/EbsC family protein [Halegenticoccus tardaugens]|uniref:YbaK/EbsC family protein n=1 Tax=Halegenticoccus tardaugens TaxID=2071624 RepID=UPI00100BD35E|nr:YbaK/EbsC family protein [Halegenticoccus tardaugens]